jgi:hypothetical protein
VVLDCLLAGCERGERMHPWFRTAAFPALLSGLAACTSTASTTGQPSPPSPSAASSSPRAPATALSTATGAIEGTATITMTRPPSSPAVVSTNVRDCFDGTCTVRVTAPADIAVDARFGFSSLHVTVAGPQVTILAHPPGGTLDVTSTVPGNTSLNNLYIVIQALSGKTVTLAFSPGPG